MLQAIPYTARTWSTVRLAIPRRIRVSFQKDVARLGCIPGGTEVEDRGSFLDEVSQGWHLIGAGDAIREVMIETDPQLCRSLRQGHKCVPGLGSLVGAWPEAHIPFAPPRACSQCGRVVVQGDLRGREHHQQVALLGACLGNA